METKNILIASLVPSVVVVILIISVVCHIRRKRRLLRKRAHHAATSSNIQGNSNIISQISGASSLKNQGDESYGVPRDMLPRDFDYSAPGVQDMGDFVVVNNLNSIQRKSIVNKDEYRTQAPYNPNY